MLNSQVQHLSLTVAPSQLLHWLWTISSRWLHRGWNIFRSKLSPAPRLRHVIDQRTSLRTRFHALEWALLPSGSNSEYFLLKEIALSYNPSRTDDHQTYGRPRLRSTLANILYISNKSASTIDAGQLLSLTRLLVNQVSTNPA